MLDTAQSSVIMWQIFRHAEGGEKSQNHHEERKDKQKFIFPPLCSYTQRGYYKKKGEGGG